MNNVAFTITGSGTISLSLNNKAHLLNPDHINYKRVIECLKAQEYDKLDELVNISRTLSDKSNGEISFVDGTVYLNNVILHNAITERIVRFYKEDLPYEPLLNMIKRLWKNPSENSREQLYRFLETNQLPVTPDGYILFYKRVNNDYTDIHSGKFDNSVGNVVKMDRSLVEEDPNKVCSSGLHVCSLGYLKNFGVGKKIVVCKVDPADIVSVPVDYSNTKVRVCEYLVVGEWTSDDVDMFDGDAIRNSDGSKYIHDDDDEDLYDEDEEFFEDDDEEDEDDPLLIESLGDCCGGRSDCRVLCAFNINNHLLDVHVGVKPDGSRYHNVRDASGRFVKRDAPKANPKHSEYGVKPDGSRYHNVRDASGKFVKKS